MGTKYSTIAIASYNASPPSDDATATETNRVKWATVKTKIGDPVKTLAEAINTALVAAADLGPNTQSSTYATIASDHLKTIQMTASFNVTLLDAATGGAGYTVTVSNQHSAANSVVRAGSDTINGSLTSFSLPPGSAVTLQVNAAANGYLVIGESDGVSGSWATYAPTVTLTGGAGNTVPVYSTNTGRYSRVGNVCFVDVYLTGDGGAEGAGSGVLTIALPVASGASFPGSYWFAGFAQNSATEYPLIGLIVAGASVMNLNYFSAIGAQDDFTGDLQNNATRTIRLHFSYEV